MGSHQEEYLDSVWAKVINLDPEGRWIERCLEQCAGLTRGPLRQVPGALKRLLRCGATHLDLGRIGRFIRYKACFHVLYLLEFPGPRKGRLTGLDKQFQSFQSGRRRGRLPEEEICGALWGMIWAADKGRALGSLARKRGGHGAFDDVGPAVKRLLKQGAGLEDLGRLARWHKYRACLDTLRLLDEAGFRSAGEVAGLHELLLSLEPSGNQARPGSWPLVGTS